MKTSDKAPATTWARWSWSHKGLGRWHRLAVDGDLTKTACSSPRKSQEHVAATTSATPTAGPVCPTCKSLDDLLQRVMSGALTDAIATTTVPAAPEKVLVPAGMCVCGCDKSDEAVAVRKAIEAQAEAEAFARAAAFEAFLQAKGTVAA